jgi:hypothetical protein
MLFMLNRDWFLPEETPTTAENNDPLVEMEQDSQKPSPSSNNYALQFDGVDDYVELPTVRDFGVEPFTIDALVSIDKPELSAVLSASAAQLNIQMYDEGDVFGAPGFSGKVGEGYWEFPRHPKLKLPIQDRVQLTFTWDGKQAKFYVNGVFVYDALRYYTKSGSPIPLKIVPVSRDSLLPTLIGKNIFSQTYMKNKPMFFKGRIEELRLSTHVLYTEDFTPQDRFEADEHTLALYHFDEGQGDVLKDFSGNGHHGKIYGARWVKMEESQVTEEPSAADLLATGEYEWRVVERLPEPINSNFGELGGDISADGLVIVFCSFRKEGSYGKEDLWMSTRTSVNSEWPPAVNLGDHINTAGNEYFPALSPDGLTLIYQSQQKILMSRRESYSEPWSRPRPFPVQSRVPPDPSSNDTVCVVTQFHQSPGGSGPDLFITRRSGPDAPWPNPTRLPDSINSDKHEFASSISEDGRLLVFGRWNQEENRSELWMTTRQDWDAGWGTPVAIETSIGSRRYGEPRLLPDGKSFLVNILTNGSPYNRDLYIARLVRKDAPLEPIKGLEEEQSKDATPKTTVPPAELPPPPPTPDSED